MVVDSPAILVPVEKQLFHFVWGYKVSLLHCCSVSKAQGQSVALRKAGLLLPLYFSVTALAWAEAKVDVLQVYLKKQ